MAPYPPCIGPGQAHTRRASRGIPPHRSSQRLRSWVYSHPHAAARGHRGAPCPTQQAGLCMGPFHAPDLAGLLFDGLYRTLHRAEQRLDLIGRLLQEEAGHKLVYVAPALVHLQREWKGPGRGWDRMWIWGLAQELGDLWGECPCFAEERGDSTASCILEAVEYPRQGRSSETKV